PTRPEGKPTPKRMGSTVPAGAGVKANQVKERSNSPRTREAEFQRLGVDKIAAEERSSSPYLSKLRRGEGRNGVVAQNTGKIKVVRFKISLRKGNPIYAKNTGKMKKEIFKISLMKGNPITTKKPGNLGQMRL